MGRVIFWEKLQRYCYLPEVDYLSKAHAEVFYSSYTTTQWFMIDYNLSFNLLMDDSSYFYVPIIIYLSHNCVIPRGPLCIIQPTKCPSLIPPVPRGNSVLISKSWDIFEDKMDGTKYKAILEESLFHSSKFLRLRLRLAFQQENEPKHTAKSTLQWFKTKDLKGKAKSSWRYVLKIAFHQWSSVVEKYCQNNGQKKWNHNLTVQSW